MKNFIPILVMIITLMLHLDKTISQDLQFISLHSISTARQIGGDSGYTLDGPRMEGAREKLTNPSNFGDGGTYPKFVSITDGYAAEGTLTQIGQADPPIDIFYFGTFNIDNAGLTQFTDAELNTLYNWSLHGGKIIIGASSSAPDVGFNTELLNERWGFTIESIQGPTIPQQNLPTKHGTNSSIFNGPFGQVVMPNQGGFAQGYFAPTENEIIVMAVDSNDNNVLYLDCHTLDLIVADGDVHNDLGGVSPGPNIENDNDRFWANTIVFMDELEDPPVILQDEGELTAGIYETYQWYLNGEEITGATESTLAPSSEGVYTITVELKNGCVKTSPEFTLETVGVEAIPAVSKFTINPNPVDENLYLNVSLIKDEILTISIQDMTGHQIMVLASNDRMPAGTTSIQYPMADIPAGTYLLTLQSQEGITSKKFIKN